MSSEEDDDSERKKKKKRTQLDELNSLISETENSPRNSAPVQMLVYKEPELVIEEEVLRRVEYFGYPGPYLVKVLKANERNYATTSYFLMLQAMRQPPATSVMK